MLGRAISSATQLVHDYCWLLWSFVVMCHQH